MTVSARLVYWPFVHVSLGIFAHNEEGNIADTLTSLLGQSIVDGEVRRDMGIASLEILCLANGCTDRTVEIAAGFQRGIEGVDYRVIDLAAPGKSRTWNDYVHRLSDPAADVLVLMDADIVFETADVIETLLRRLRADDGIDATTDTPLKMVLHTKERLSLTDRASVGASGQRMLKGAICGQLYCARASVLRCIWLPPSLPVEDGFIAAMIKTGGFTRDEEPDRILCVPAARHFYATHLTVGGFIRHEARIIVGSVINFWLFTLLWEQGRTAHVGRFIADRNAADPDWLDRLVEGKVARQGAWLIPTHFMFWRLAPLKGQPFATLVRRAPIALAATLLNLIACLRANAILKRKDAARHW